MSRFYLQPLFYPRWLHQLFWLILGLLLVFTLGSTPLAMAATDLTHQTPIEVKVSLGDSTNALRFVPNQLQFEAGKRHKLLLSNPSTLKHYFTAKDFAGSIWSQKVEAGMVEVKGAINDLELKPNAMAEWVFIPIKSGIYELHCSVPGHSEAGMTGTLTITAPKSPT